MPLLHYKEEEEKDNKMMAITYRKLILLGVLLSTFMAFFWFKTAPQQPPKKQPIVKVEKVQRQDLTEKLELIGNVVAFESVIIKSRLDSQIEEVFIKDGSLVQQNDKLFQLDDRFLKAQLEEAKANLQSSKAELIRAEHQYNRDTSLSKKGVVAKEQFDRSTQAYQAAKAAVEATEAKIHSLMTQISYADIRSPISGIAGTINVTKGNVVKANDTIGLVVINKIDPLYIDIPLPQRYFASYQKNIKDLKVVIHTGEHQEIKVSTLTSIQNAFDVSSRTLMLRATVENADHRLWPGMFVDVDLDIKKEKSTLIIPLKSILRTQKGEQVFKIVENKSTLVPVKVLFTTAENAAVEGDLKEGELIVIEGGFNLREKDLVKIAGKDDK